MIQLIVVFFSFLQDYISFIFVLDFFFVVFSFGVVVYLFTVSSSGFCPYRQHLVFGPFLSALDSMPCVSWRVNHMESCEEVLENTGPCQDQPCGKNMTVCEFLSCVCS